jgi:hypothetical protein
MQNVTHMFESCQLVYTYSLTFRCTLSKIFDFPSDRFDTVPVCLNTDRFGHISRTENSAAKVGLCTLSEIFDFPSDWFDTLLNTDSSRHMSRIEKNSAAKSRIAEVRLVKKAYR